MEGKKLSPRLSHTKFTQGCLQAVGSSELYVIDSARLHEILYTVVDLLQCNASSETAFPYEKVGFETKTSMSNYIVGSLHSRRVDVLLG